MSSNIEPGARVAPDAWRGARSWSWHEDSRKDPDELEREIDETRADVQATLQALERKLSPDRLFDRTLGRVREGGGEFVHNLTDQVRRNPMPVILTSIGIAWMMMNGRRGDGIRVETEREPRFGRVRERLEHAKEGAADAKESLASAGQALRESGKVVRDRLQRSGAAMSDASRGLGRRSRRAASAARDEWTHARATFDQMLEEQPLMLGAIGLAAGALIGALLPATAAEDRRLGPLRDQALERAREGGEQGLHKAREQTERLAEHAKQRLGAGDEPQRREDLDVAGERGLAGTAGESLRQGAGAAAGREDVEAGRNPAGEPRGPSGEATTRSDQAPPI